MSTFKTGWGAAGALLLAAALGTAWYQWNNYNVADQALATRRQEHTALLATLRGEEQRATTAEREATRLRQELAALRAPNSAPASPAPAPAAPAWDSVREGQAFLERHPAVRQALSDYANASLRFQFAPMYRELGLNTQQIARWQLLRGTGSMMGAAYTDGRTLSLVNGERIVDGQRIPDEPLAALFRELGVSDTQQAQRLVLGEAGIARIVEFQNIGYARRFAMEVASALYFTDTPLAPAQADALVQVLVASRNRGPEARSSQFDWNAVMAKAVPVLAPPQLAVLSGLRAADLFNGVLNRPASTTPAPKSGN